MINRKQLEALHRSLPEDWAPKDDVRSVVMDLLSLPEWDHAAGEGVLTTLSLAGVAEHSNGSKLWRRGVLPPELSPAEELKLAEDRQRAERDREFKEGEERRLREENSRAEVLAAPEKFRLFTFIDERVANWLTALGFDESQIAAARATLPNPMLREAESPVEPPRFVTHLPPGAVVVTGG